MFSFGKVAHTWRMLKNFYSSAKNFPMSVPSTVNNGHTGKTDNAKDSEVEKGKTCFYNRANFCIWNVLNQEIECLKNRQTIIKNQLFILGETKSIGDQKSTDQNKDKQLGDPSTGTADMCFI